VLADDGLGRTVTDTVEPLTQQMVQTRVKRAARKAGLSQAGVHILRHTFCWHLAMRGAPARAIQELAGHEDLSMTRRYMHLSPAALDGAIRLLEQPAGPVQPGRILQNRGDVGETAPEEVKKINKSGQ